MDSLKNRLDKVQKLGNFKTRKELSSFIGIAYTTMNKWIERGEITPAGIMKIQEKYPQISKTYLETGTGDILKLDSGISNYGHDARTQEVCEAYQAMSNEDKEIVYNIVKRFRKNEGIRLTAFDEDFEDKEL